MTATLVWLVVGTVGTVATVIAVARVPREARLAWALVAGGCFVVWLTGVTLGELDLAGGRPTFVGLAPGLLAYPLLVAGLLLIRRGGPLRRVTDVLDALVAALAAVLVGWILFWHPHFRANGILITATVAHPIGALIVLTVAVAVVFSHCLRPIASALLIASIAALLAMTSILASTVTETTLGVTHEAAVPVLWALFPVLLAAAGLQRWPPRQPAEGSGPTPLTVWRIVLIVVAAMLGPATWVIIVASNPPQWALAETAVPVITDAVLSLIVLLRLLITRAALQRARALLVRQATLDPLTGLPNRAALMTALDTAFPNDAGTRAAVLLLDVDGFKQVNDTLGHPAGDAALLIVAERLAATVPPGATLSRLGGDEFAIVLEQTNGQMVAALAETICTELRRPYTVDGHDVRMSASIGVLLAEGEDYTRMEALRAADVALYTAKAAGRDQWARYDLKEPPDRR